MDPVDAAELFAAIAGSRELHRPWVDPPASVDELRASLAQPPDARVAYGVRTDRRASSPASST